MYTKDSRTVNSCVLNQSYCVEDYTPYRVRKALMDRKVWHDVNVPGYSEFIVFLCEILSDNNSVLFEDAGLSKWLLGVNTTIHGTRPECTNHGTQSESTGHGMSPELPGCRTRHKQTRPKRTVHDTSQDSNGHWGKNERSTQPANLVRFYLECSKPLNRLVSSYPLI